MTTAAAVSSHSFSNGDWVNLQEQGVPPMVQEGHSYYIIVDHSMKKFSQFLSYLPPSVEGLEGWKRCSQCRCAWPDLSKVGVFARGVLQPAYLSNIPSKYGELAPAVEAFQDAFRKGQVQQTVMFEIPDTERHGATSLGHRYMGVRPPEHLDAGHPYIHACMDVNLPKNPQATKLNELLNAEVPLVEQFICHWSLEVIDTILKWYEVKGQEAPGYKVNIGGLRWFSCLLQDIADQHAGKKINYRRMLVIKNLIKLLSGPHPDDALGATHIFSSGSNLAACRHARSPETFWKIMDARYNPITYRQPTAAPTEGQIEAALQKLGNDLSCYERVYLDTSDPQVTSRALWTQSTPPPAHDVTCITADELRATAVQKGKGKMPSTCFDNVKPKGDTCTSYLTPDEFDKWIVSQPAGSKIDWLVLSNVTPIAVGVPVTTKGSEMMKVPAGWSVNPYGQTASTSGFTAQAWQSVETIVPHPGRWTHEGGLSTREAAIVSDGYVVVTHQRVQYDPPGSCLFAEFFRGEYHNLDKVRQKLQTTLRIRKPDTLPVSRVFKGCLISVTLRGSRWLTDRGNITFRVSRPDGTQQMVVLL